MSAQQSSHDLIMVFCPKCGHQFPQRVEYLRRKPRGSGASYIIKKLNETHETALEALFSLDAASIDSRKPLSEICQRIYELKSYHPNRNGIGGRLSEMQNPSIAFVKSFPNEIERISDLPEFRDQGKWEGWYLTKEGLDYVRGKVGYEEKEKVPREEYEANIGDILPKRIGTVVWEKDHAVIPPRKELIAIRGE